MPHRFARLERMLGRLLVSGVAASAICLGAGLAASMIGWPGAGVILQLGLWVLMATPVVRVGVSFVEYVRQRDWFFACTTLAVLAVIAAAFVVAWRA